MASKSLVFVLACFLLISTKVLSETEEEHVELNLDEDFGSRPDGTACEGTAIAPTWGPTYKSSPPPPPSKSPPPIIMPPPVSKPPPPVSKPPPPISKPPPPVSKPPPPISKPPTPVSKPPPPVSKPPPPPPRNKQECFSPCVVRCKNHSRKNICMRACLTCCDRCKCVPPGQYGNKEKCGTCYSSMTTRGGKFKCP